MDASDTPAPAAVQQRSKTSLITIRILTGLICFAGVLMVGVIVTFAFGGVQGEEFSPDTFTRRRYEYYEVPLFRVQVGPISRVSNSGPVEQTIVGQNYVQAQNSQKPRWDLVWENGVDPKSNECDARILCAYLDAADGDGNLIWLGWTSDNSALAKVLWPAVAKVARQGLYVFVPDLMEQASTARDAIGLRKQIDETLAEKYHRLATARHGLGEYKAAVEYFSEALAHDAACVDALEGRAKSYDKLEERDQADADRAAAQRLNAERANRSRN